MLVQQAAAKDVCTIAREMTRTQYFQRLNADIKVLPEPAAPDMENPHQFRVSRVHEFVGKFPAFYKVLQGFRGYLIHITVD